MISMMSIILEIKNRNMNIFTIFKQDCFAYILPTATMIMKGTIITTMTIILKNMMLR